MNRGRVDDTARNILIAYDDGYSYVAERVKQVLDPVEFPVMTRRERWGYSPDQYLHVFYLTDHSGEDDNVIRYDVSRAESEVLDKPEIRHRNLTDRMRQQHIGDFVAEMVLESLQGLL